MGGAEDQTNVLLVGETWMSVTTHYKGWDSFTTAVYENGGERFSALLRSGGAQVTQLKAHDVPASFPAAREELDRFDVVVLSDIGANSILLAPDTWVHGKSAVNRLVLLRDWVLEGGALVMVGGYLSFQGIHGTGRWRQTPVADVLPVDISPFDDRMETPEGLKPDVVASGHPITARVGSLPVVLGYNKVVPRAWGATLATVNEDPLLVVGQVGKGRCLAWTSDIGPHWCPSEAYESVGFASLWLDALSWLTATGGPKAAGRP